MHMVRLKYLFWSCMQAVYRDSHLIEKVAAYTCVLCSSCLQADVPSLVPESAAAIVIILTVGTKRAVLCYHPPIQSRIVGSCVIKTQCGRFDTAWHGRTWHDEAFGIHVYKQQENKENQNFTNFC